MFLRTIQFIYKRYISIYTPRRGRIVTAAALALLLSGCSTFLFAAFIWTGILLLTPFYVVSLPFYPLYYAVQGLPGDTGSQIAVFSPDGEHLVVAYQQRRHMNLYRVTFESGAS